MNTRLAVAFIACLLPAAPLVAQEKEKPKDKSAAVRDELLKHFGEKVDIRLDQPYAGTDNPFQQLDIFLPKNPKSDKPVPVIVMIHGGGWKGGDRKGYDGVCGLQAMTGDYAAISVGYRLSAEAKWPAQIHDCKAAIRWIRAHAKELKIDPDRIGVTGGSAGGHLVTLLGLTNETKDLDGKLGPHTDVSSKVSCVVNVCGPSDLSATLGTGDVAKVTDQLVEELVGGKLDAKRDAVKSASPLTYVSPKAVPIMTIHGTADNVVNFNQAQKLNDALTKAGTTTLLIPIVNAGHNVPFGPELNARVQAFWGKYLRNVPAEISTKSIEAPKPAAK